VVNTADEHTVAAVGKLSEALEWLERARGRLYDFHQMLGHVDFQLSDAAAKLADCGQDRWANTIETELVGRNVLDGRWTFQIIEEFEDAYYNVIRDVERRIREDLVGGERHTFERRLKEARRSKGVPGHEWLPAATHGAPGAVQGGDGEGHD
jgi:hypothetical protein